MRRRLGWWKLFPVSLTLAGSGAALLVPAPAPLVAQEDKESFTVFPVSLNQVRVIDSVGDLDKRTADPASRDGLLWVAPGDSLQVTVTAPDDLKGMVGFCNLNYAIREEFERNCRRQIVHHPRTPPLHFGTSLRVGDNVKIQLILESLVDSRTRPVRYLKLGKNDLNDLNDLTFPAKVLVKFQFTEGDVVFNTRNQLEPQEYERFIKPQLDALRTNPNVELKQPPYLNVVVGRGNVDQLKVRISGCRKQR
jgi:hypothetical protein